MIGCNFKNGNRVVVHCVSLSPQVAVVLAWWEKREWSRWQSCFGIALNLQCLVQFLHLTPKYLPWNRDSVKARKSSCKWQLVILLLYSVVRIIFFKWTCLPDSRNSRKVFLSLPQFLVYCFPCPSFFKHLAHIKFKQRGNISKKNNVYQFVH